MSRGDDKLVTARTCEPSPQIQIALARHGNKRPKKIPRHSSFNLREPQVQYLTLISTQLHIEGT